jgi:hypothetical protein
MRAVTEGKLEAYRPTGGARGLILFRRLHLLRWIETSAIENLKGEDRGR